MGTEKTKTDPHEEAYLEGIQFYGEFTRNFLACFSPLMRGDDYYQNDEAVVEMKED